MEHSRTFVESICTHDKYETRALEDTDLSRPSCDWISVLTLNDVIRNSTVHMHRSAVFAFAVLYIYFLCVRYLSLEFSCLL